MNKTHKKKKKKNPSRRKTAAAPSQSAARWANTRRRLPLALGFILAGTVIWVVTRGDDHLPPAEYTCEVVNRFPHDPLAFTQGLVFVDGFLYESTGKRSESTVRKVELKTGKVLQQVNLEEDLFGEGLAAWKDELIQLTWEARTGIVYDRATLEEKHRFSYSGEGWGLTTDGQNLIVSNGSPEIRFLDPKTFKVIRRLKVTDGGRPLRGKMRELNELEFVEGEIFANVWYKDRIAIISPASGAVTGWVDISGIVPEEARREEDAVANGIAYDAKSKRLFVTGKNWPSLIEIKIKRVRGAPKS